MLIFDCFIYILLYYYFENVFPNEYGVKKHPCFLLISLKNCITDQFNKISLINQGFRNIDGNNNIELINESDQQSEIIQQNPSSAIIYEPIANLNNRKVIKSFHH
jgi:ATP-binding cassette subfamily A (ABC1) protein 3